MSEFLKAFNAKQIKAAGITEALLAQAATVLKRRGTGRHLALAMYLKKGGATQEEVKAATGSPQVNVFRDLTGAAGLAKAEDLPKEGGLKRYKLVLTAKAKPKKAPAKKAASKKAKAPAQEPANAA